MKNNHIYARLFITVLLTFFVASCSIHTSSTGSGKVPPGQAKKGAGSTSAKPFAPGQKKKS